MMFKYYISKLFRKVIALPSIKNSTIPETSIIGSMCSINECKMGKYSYVGDFTNISYARIGSFTSISSYCAIGGGEHPIDWVSTSPVFTEHRSVLRFQFAQNCFNPYKEVSIGNDVWIGTHCLIKSGISISDGAIIGMGSVVTKDVGPYEIWAGNPAKLIRKRFPDKIIADLIRSEWWTWNNNKISERATLFNDVDLFIRENMED